MVGVAAVVASLRLRTVLLPLQVIVIIRGRTPRNLIVTICNAFSRRGKSLLDGARHFTTQMFLLAQIGNQDLIDSDDVWAVVLIVALFATAPEFLFLVHTQSVEVENFAV